MQASVVVTIRVEPAVMDQPEKVTRRVARAAVMQAMRAAMGPINVCHDKGTCPAKIKSVSVSRDF